MTRKVERAGIIIVSGYGEAFPAARSPWALMPWFKSRTGRGPDKSGRVRVLSFGFGKGLHC
jgi:hypothetical protein